MIAPRPLALYVHWPFCLSKCPYCDFNSHVRDTVDQASWKEALLQELRWYAQQGDVQPLRSIFFGGGTPSLMPPETVKAVISQAEQLFGLAPDCEITLEANPTSVEASRFAALAKAGVNRISLGVQSFQAESLAFLGRQHSADEAKDAIVLAADTVPRYSFDLIYALPNQTLAQWEAELEAALKLARGHLSLYQLTIEPGTQFYHQFQAGKFTMPDDALAADFYDFTDQRMTAADMPAYEISNYAAAGQASRHNLTYWQGGGYIGIGPGAHGRLHRSMHDQAQSTLPQRIATTNHRSPEKWLAAVQQQGQGQESAQMLSHDDWMDEAIIMGLRLIEGLRADYLPLLPTQTLADCWSEADLQPLIAEGLLAPLPHWPAAAISTTSQGRLLLGSVTTHLAMRRRPLSAHPAA